MGEVGTALTEVLGCDGFDEGITAHCEVLHVAFPYSPDFVAAVNQHTADLVVVHSTVPVGTCDPQGWVHSPVRGRHPDLVDALKTFRKPFGGSRSIEAVMRWPYQGLAFSDARHTEAGKLWELAQFGLQVRVTQAIHEWCDTKGLDPALVYDMFAQDYNTGYEALGESRFVRPILDYVAGPIGGHCVTENMAYIDHQIAALVRDGF